MSTSTGTSSTTSQAEGEAPGAAGSPGLTSAESTSTATTTVTTAGSRSGSSEEGQRAKPGGGSGASRTAGTAKGQSLSGVKRGAGTRAAGQSGEGASTGAVSLGTPPLPFSLRAPITGVPAFFIETLSVPPFLLPIYEAAGIAYDVPWEVLAAINEVETDYGRDLSISSAGAEGWMQFLPQEWRIYGVDATGSGYADPYNPADAIFAAARYLAAAGGSSHIRAAVYAYNHSEAYVAAVMMRAQLLAGMPPQLLSALMSLTEARFPVHAPAHFSDGFPEVASPKGHLHPIAGTTIYSVPRAPVIAVADGTITAIGRSRALGLYVRLRDAYGNRYTYADLGSIAGLYPVLSPRRLLPARSRRLPVGPPPKAPASAGVQRHSPLSEAATRSGLAFGLVEALREPPRGISASGGRQRPLSRAAREQSRSFTAGIERVTLRPLKVGAHVIAGTILGHLAGGGDGHPGSGVQRGGEGHLEGGGEAHMLFQIQPAGAGLIDPKPILDGWVALEDTQIFKAKGENPFFATSPTPGQALLESAGQLQQQVLRNRGIRLEGCMRAEVAGGAMERQVLAMLELLSVSGLNPTVSGRGCKALRASLRPGARFGVSAASNDGPSARSSGAAATALALQPSAAAGSALRRAASGETVVITAINGLPVASQTGLGGLDDAVERKLIGLQATMKPAAIAGPVRYPSAEGVDIEHAARSLRVSFAPPVAGGRSSGAVAAAASASSGLSASAWQALIARLAQIPSPAVASTPSAAAIPDAQLGSEGGP